MPLSPRYQKTVTVTDTATALFALPTECLSLEVYSDDGNAVN
jgi:hypothetical protein